MIVKRLLETIYDSAYVQRWNDQMRFVELTELDKQAHKMTIAYLLGKFEEGRSGFSWTAVIEAGLFDFLQRLVLTDLKPQLVHEIEKDGARYRDLNAWVFRRLRPVIAPLGPEFTERYRAHFAGGDDDVNRRIVRAAHVYASKWDFEIVERCNPAGYGIADIARSFRMGLDKYGDLAGIRQLGRYRRYRDFVAFCGLLRFQTRWGNLYRIPRTSVLGHMLVVAMLSYLFSLEIGACPRRRVNNYFTGLFHDLPEVLTRDVISPVKHSVPGLSQLIKQYEKKEMTDKVFPLVPAAWRKELALYTGDEFRNVVTVGGRARSPSLDVISRDYNRDEFNARDGELVAAVDTLAALLEAHLALGIGIKSQRLLEATEKLQGGLERSVLCRREFGGIHRYFREYGARSKPGPHRPLS